MANTELTGSAYQRQPEQFGIALDPFQHFRIGELEILNSRVNIGFPLTVEQAGQTEAFDESLDFAGSHRFLLQIDQLKRHAALLKEPFSGSSRVGVLQTENLDVQHSRGI